MPPPSLPLESQYPDVIDISWRTNLRYDPRIGDEDDDNTYTSYHGPRDAPPLRQIRIETPSWGPGGSQGRSSPSDTAKQSARKQKRSCSDLWDAFCRTAAKYFPLDLSWIPANFSWPKIKPVIRSSAMAFVSVIFMVLSPVENVTGQVCLPCTPLVRSIHGVLRRLPSCFSSVCARPPLASSILTRLSAAFLDPPSDPFISVLERELIFALFVTLGWACVFSFIPSVPFLVLTPRQVVLPRHLFRSPRSPKHRLQCFHRASAHW